MIFFFFSSRRRHTRWTGDWSSDVCSSDLFIAMSGQFLAKNASEIRFRRAGRRSVIVGQVEMGDAEIEGAQDQVAAGRLRIDVPEILPQPKRQAGQLQAALAAMLIFHFLVTGRIRLVAHGKRLSENKAWVT